MGADLLLVARDAGRLATAVAAITEATPACRVETLAADVALDEDRERICAAAGERLQILVNNAGTNIRKKMADISFEEYRHVQETNTASAFEMSRRLYLYP